MSERSAVSIRPEPAQVEAEAEAEENLGAKCAKRNHPGTNTGSERRHRHM